MNRMPCLVACARLIVMVTRACERAIASGKITNVGTLARFRDHLLREAEVTWTNERVNVDA